MCLAAEPRKSPVEYAGKLSFPGILIRMWTFRLNVWAAESCLRRALEALLDLGHHMLAKGFGQPVIEYREIAQALVRVRILNQEDGVLLRKLAGYRNRLVHFYHEVSDLELYEILYPATGRYRKAMER
jgi:uncharacterized protein YutE (UPF0331/DUF86 family)